MKKFFSTFISILLLFLGLFFIILSTKGIETKKFNSFVSNKINQSNYNVNLKLNSIKFKLDVNEISLFLETIKPQINYRNVLIPTKNVRVYIDFVSLLKSRPKIKKVKLLLEELDINQFKKISTTLKPSNFKSFLNNKIKNGKLISELEFYLNENNTLENFIARGSVSNLNAKIINDLILEKTSFSFFADKTDVLIKNIFGELDSMKIKDGDIKFKLSPEITLKSNFLSRISYSNKSFAKYFNLLENFKYAKEIVNLDLDLNNNLLINFDETYKVKNYSFTNKGKISKAVFKFEKPLSNYFLNQDINELSIINSEIQTNFNLKKSNTNISGKYSLNNKDFLEYNLKNNINKNSFNLELDLRYNQDFNLDFINYQKSKDTVANLSINLKKEKDSIKVDKFNISEKNNFISLEGLEINKNKFFSFKKISVKTNKDNKKNNDFSILYGKKIKIKGSQFDATNLPKILAQKKTNNAFSKINKEIEIDFTSITAPLSENLKNFKLIGSIEKGKFVKISSKGDFGNKNFLDISMKNDKKNKKKYLEIYSDLPKPLLNEYSFFKGLVGGKLLYSSIIDGKDSNSKLKIENFKVINAPGMIKLLSLADLAGLADLAKGEGLSFDVLEINMNSNSKGFLNLEEILALGPSISVLMEGYQDQNGLTSLRGTLVPAKNFNKLISKIPLLGNIIIPKEVGEGLFGISFKMKGPPGKIKTTINPIKTLTPRFIQKIIERNKNIK